MRRRGAWFAAHRTDRACTHVMHAWMHAPARLGGPLADGHGRVRVARPLAPRSGVEARARQPGELEREQVVARGDARAAVAHRLVAAADAELREPASERVRREEGAPVEV